MNAGLVYVVGPSGAGKDSLLAWLKAHLPPGAAVDFARRTITRAASPQDEDHESLALPAFLQLRDAGVFGMDWEANGLHYGVRRTELAPRPGGGRVIVNGSRAYLPEAASRYPGMTVVHVTAEASTLRQRLATRGRETPEQVEQRIQRALAFQMPPGLATIEIRNDGALAQAGEQLRALLLK